MTSKPKAAPSLKDSDQELLDDIERALLKAKDAKRPFVEFLLRLAFLEASENVSRKK